jgi:lysophospholipase L1-like esterase
MAGMRWVAAALVVALAACGGGSEEGSSTTTESQDPSTTTTAAPLTPGYGSIEETYEGDGRRVVVFGDSLTVQSRGALGRELTDYALKVAAVRGEGLGGGPFSERFETEMMLGAAETYAKDDPEVAVLALGTNDAWSEKLSVPAAREAWQTMTALFDQACIVGVTVTEETAATGYDVDEARAINELIVDGADEVVDWRELGPPVTAGDGIHLTPEGAAVRAEAIRRAVEACPGA